MSVTFLLGVNTGFKSCLSNVHILCRKVFIFLLRCLQNLHLLGATAIEDKLQDVSYIFHILTINCFM